MMREHVEPAPSEAVSRGDRTDLRVVVQPPPVIPSCRLTDYRKPITGERVVVQQPLGWIFDIRAAGEPERVGDKTLVPVTLESEWYVAQREGREPVSHLVDVRAVFVERPQPA